MKAFVALGVLALDLLPLLSALVLVWRPFAWLAFCGLCALAIGGLKLYGHYAMAQGRRGQHG